MRFFKRNWKTILSAVIVLLVIAAAIAGTSIHSVKDEQKRAMEALQPVEIGEEQILSEEEAALSFRLADSFYISRVKGCISPPQISA